MSTADRSRRLPVGGLVVLEELAPDVLAGVGAGDDRVDDAGGSVDDVERRVEPVLGLLLLGDVDRVLVADPAGVDAVHVDAVGVVVGGRGWGSRSDVRRVGKGGGRTVRYWGGPAH